MFVLLQIKDLQYIVILELVVYTKLYRWYMAVFFDPGNHLLCHQMAITWNIFFKFLYVAKSVNLYQNIGSYCEEN